jgi:hypothetical protein
VGQDLLTASAGRPSPAEPYAITGGTGAYAGAAGEPRLHGPEQAEQADITFAG